MNKYEIIKRIEEFAPPESQEKWDCSGWIVETQMQEVSKILYALTITEDVYNQAERHHCDMIISHHPLFTVPIKYSGIDIYCAHTNLDKAVGGTTDYLIQTLKFTDTKIYNDFVRIVELENEMSIEYLKLKLLPISPRLRLINNNNVKTIRTIGFCAGSGSEYIDETPCDAFVTGDLKYHTAVETQKVVFDIGHFESEIFAPQLLKHLCNVQENGIIANEKSPFI